MAQLFLSYSRKDSAKARRFGEWLEREGHEVWRDEDDIGGGASFSSEIEKALKECDAVLVLWSADSVQSAWVRDEAGYGRDSGKLIPFSVDGTEAPLGFRQFQSIGLAKWRGQGQPPNPDRIRHAIERVTGRAADPSPAASTVRSERRSRRLMLAAAAAALVALAIAAIIFWRSSKSSDNPIVIAVSASPTSPDKSAATDYANVAAADIAAFLRTHFDQASVIAPADAVARNAGHRMLISANARGKGSDASLTLSDSDGHTIIWSKSWSAEDASTVNLAQEISRSASQAALCLTEAKGGKKRLVQPALSIFMSGCVGIGDSEWSDAQLLAAFERVVRLAPEFPRGWEYLAIGRSVAAQSGSPAAIKGAREAISTARKLNPRSGLAYLAETILNPEDRAQVLARLDKGTELEPDNALLQTTRADALQTVGRLADSVKGAKRAVELDPLASFVRSNYIMALTYAGQFSEAKADIAEARKKWPNDPEIDLAEFSLQFRYGDPLAAEKLMPRVLHYSDAQLVPYRKVVAARIDPTPAKIDDAINIFRSAPSGDPRARNRLLLALGLFGKVDDTYALLEESGFQRLVDPSILFRPEFAPVRADPRFMKVAADLKLLSYWRSTGNWPDFCTSEQLAYDCKTEAAKYPG